MIFAVFKTLDPRREPRRSNPRHAYTHDYNVLVRAERLDKNEAGRALNVAVAVILTRLHHPATATAGDCHGLPAGLFTRDAVSAAARAQLALHRRGLTLDADRSALHQVVGRCRLRRGTGHVAPRTNTRQLEHHTVPGNMAITYATTFIILLLLTIKDIL